MPRATWEGQADRHAALQSQEDAACEQKSPGCRPEHCLTRACTTGLWTPAASPRLSCWQAAAAALPMAGLALGAPCCTGAAGCVTALGPAAVELRGRCWQTPDCCHLGLKGWRSAAWPGGMHHEWPACLDPPGLTWPSKHACTALGGACLSLCSARHTTSRKEGVCTCQLGAASSSAARPRWRCLDSAPDACPRQEARYLAAPMGMPLLSCTAVVLAGWQRARTQVVRCAPDKACSTRAAGCPARSWGMLLCPAEPASRGTR